LAILYKLAGNLKRGYNVFMNIWQYLLLFSIALIPSFFWLWFFTRYDWQKKEPAALILKVFIWGVLCGFPIIFLEQSLENYFLVGVETSGFLFLVVKSFLVVALLEEGFKMLVVRNKVFYHPAFDERVDGIIYCVTVGLGLAAFENIASIFIEGPSLVFYRFATTTLMHALAAGVMGFFIGAAKFNPDKEKRLIFLGLVIAIIFHGTYNVIVKSAYTQNITYLLIWLLVMFSVVLALIKLTTPTTCRLSPPTNPTRPPE